MKKNFIYLALIFTTMFTACNEKKEVVKGINPDNMDTSIAPGDDFFQYSNGG